MFSAEIQLSAEVCCLTAFFSIDNTKLEFISLAIYGQERTAKALRKQSHGRAAENRSMTSHPQTQRRVVF
jgi:hypothetical protein